MVSALDLAKRALVTLLKSLAVVYNVSVSVTRDASDKDAKELKFEGHRCVGIA